MIVSKDLVKKLRKTNSDISINTASYHDADGFVFLMNKHYKRRFSSEYFYWRYLKNVNCKLFIAKKNKKIIGFSGIQIRVLSNKKLCSLTTDVLIDRDFRGRGILVLLEYEMEKFARENSISAMVVFANKIGKKAFTRAGNWKHIGTIDTLQYVPSTHKLRNVILSEVTPSRWPNGLHGRWDEAKDPMGFFPCQKEGQSDIGCGLNSKTLFFKADSKYRNWRFNLNPMYNYKKVEVNSTNFIYTKKFIDPVDKNKYGDIVDFACDINNEKNLKELFTQAILSFTSDIKTITTWVLPHTLLYQIGKKLGFDKTGKETFFCVKVLNHRYNYLYDFKKWCLVQADSEVY